ncbi:protocatechuate 3,4-dioxygenase subunit alpha [Methylobacterium sp. E-066]|uniref:protocatechuate 3,4-dioxygenase subunit alpha n=1 Tax=Methylobacterium sp. E-066 TaxID=2836584 RepID=UPI001FBBD701|nr:protocatechuate 3,4-dioxygenase subunit alpha [Methylobacterium sp. E-066]MCJ2143313.1 protocatechuate 3,4-dioxygenase subunit alpha [Methylobacterium sp. E-066]
MTDDPIGLPRNPDQRPDNQDPALFGQTPWQTVGPFFHYGLPWKGGADLVGGSDIGARTDLFPEEHDVLHRAPPRGPVRGEAIALVGTVRDGEGRPVPDAMIEIWGANAAGRYHGAADDRADVALDPGFIGFGRAAVSAEGTFRFLTVKPGPVPLQVGGNRWQAPHIAVGVFGRGLLKRLVTRVYFADADANEEDPILALVPEARRQTLVAPRVGEDPPTYRFDIVLSGDGETVFFDL